MLKQQLWTRTKKLLYQQLIVKDTRKASVQHVAPQAAAEIPSKAHAQGQEK